MRNHAEYENQHHHDTHVPVPMRRSGRADSVYRLTAFVVLQVCNANTASRTGKPFSLCFDVLLQQHHKCFLNDNDDDNHDNGDKNNKNIYLELKYVVV